MNFYTGSSHPNSASGIIIFRRRLAYINSLIKKSFAYAAIALSKKLFHGCMLFLFVIFMLKFYSMKNFIVFVFILVTACSEPVKEKSLPELLATGSWIDLSYDFSDKTL